MIAEDRAGWFAPASEKTLVEAVDRLSGKAVEMLLSRRKPIPRTTFASWQFSGTRPLDALEKSGVSLEKKGNPRITSGGLSLETDGYLESDSLLLRNAPQTGLTLSAWIRPSPAAMEGVRMIFCEWANKVETDRFSLSLNNGCPGMGVADGKTGEGGFASQEKVPTNEWTHIAGTWNPVDRRYCVYINGKMVATAGRQTGSGLRKRGPTTFKIGAQASPSNPRQFLGKINAIWIGNYLNPAGIQELFQHQKKPQSP